MLLGADGEEERGVEERQGQIGHFTVLLSPQQLEINILLDGVSTSKFVRNQSVHQQIVKFCMSASKEGSLACPVANFS